MNYRDLQKSRGMPCVRCGDDERDVPCVSSTGLDEVRHGCICIRCFTPYERAALAARYEERGASEDLRILTEWNR
jgi:hypothetical protein